MIGIPIGLAYANAGEWFLHKYVLHGLGKNKKSFWAFHWHDHHRASRRNDMVDPVYEQSLLHWTPKTKEAVSLVGLALVHLPLFPVAPFFTTAVLASIANYYRVHSRAHRDPAWARAHLGWHVDHHLGKNQNLNWCVTHPFFDWVMRTRQKYDGGTPATTSTGKRTAASPTATAPAAEHANAAPAPA